MLPTLLGVSSVLSVIDQYLLHEGGHVLTARLLGHPAKRIGINWKGIYIVRESAGTRWKDAAVALAGPLASAVVWGVFVWCAVPLANLGLFMVLFNLLPIKGSDGYNAFRYLRGKPCRAI